MRSLSLEETQLSAPQSKKRSNCFFDWPREGSMEMSAAGELYVAEQPSLIVESRDWDLLMEMNEILSEPQSHLPWAEYQILPVLFFSMLLKFGAFCIYFGLF